MSIKTLFRVLVILGLLALCGGPLPASLGATTAPAYPLKLGTDGRHLVDQNNIPFLMQGDAPWSLIAGLSDADVQTYLADRKAKGFNAVLVNLIEHKFSPHPPADYYGDQPFLKAGDFSTPNEAYFAHVDTVINQAAANGMVVLLIPAYLGNNCGDEGWCAEIKHTSTAVMQGFGEYLGNRYKNFPNIIWVEGGDTSAAANGVSAQVDALVAGIKANDTAHLHTADCSRQSSAADCYQEPWLDINTTYSDCLQSASRIRTDYNRRGVMPFFYIEGTYEGEGASAACVHAQAYYPILGGSTGQVFGNNPIWLFGSGWKSALNSAGAMSMMYLGNLFHSRPWDQLVPDYNHATVTAGYGNIGGDNYAAAARTSDGNTVIVYMPTKRTITVDLTRISGSEANAWWFNPSTGSSTLIGTYPTTGSQGFTPPGNGDWVLVIDNAALGLPAPGTTDGGSPGADVWMTKTASAGSVTSGGQLSYTLITTNNGPDTATAVTVTDALPAGLTIDSVTPQQGSCSTAGLTVSCNIGNLAVGTYVPVQIVTTVASVTAGTITNSAQASAAEPDPDPANNSDNVSTVIVSAPALPTVSLSATPASIVSGDSVSLSWSSTDATSCTASGAWNGTQPTSGTLSVSPSGTGTYTLSCTGPGGSASDSATVTVTYYTHWWHDWWYHDWFH